MVKTTFLAAVVLALFISEGRAEQATILVQPDSPLEITRYSNRYKSPDRVGDGTIIQRASVKNVSKKKIDAYGIGFYIFDSFKRSMGRPFVGYAMNEVEASGNDAPGWEQRPSSAFLFQNHGHGLAYVAIVRFEDGTIWEADSNSITKQLEDFEFELEATAIE